MQVAAPVRFKFLRNADFAILAIDKNDVFLKHESNISPEATRAVATLTRQGAREALLNDEIQSPFVASSWPFGLRANLHAGARYQRR